MRSFVFIMNLFMFHVPLTLGFSIGKPININSVSMPFTTRATSTLYSEPSAGAEIGTGLSEPDSDSSVASKFFQLEEKEDKDSCTTELFLAKDGTVTLAETDGPLPVRATGVWSQQGNEFRMKIKRTFNGGQPGRDVGEFLFDVERGFTGFLEIVGGLTCVDGSMHILDADRGDLEVGFFSMLDTTNIKLSMDEENEA